MITFDQSAGVVGHIYTCFLVNGQNHPYRGLVGWIRLNDGFYEFEPLPISFYLSSSVLKEIVNKLEDLNSPTIQKILSERETESHPFTD